MRIGTTRADRIGFVVLVSLASLLATLLIAGSKGDDQVQAISAFVDLPAVGSAAIAEPAAPVATTEPIPRPTGRPEAAAAAPLLPAFDAPDDEAAEETAEEDTATDGSGAAEAGVAVDTDSQVTEANETPAEDDLGVEADSQSAGGQTAEVAADSEPVPNPQPPAATATAVPNPQAPETTATAVPNPQPATNQNIAAPAPVAAGGSFTHTLTATVSRPTLYTAPGGTPFTPTFNGTALPAVNPTVFGNPLVYRVIAGTPDDASGWAQVYVPARPNGTTAWVQTSEFRWGSSNRMIQINVSNNTVTIFEGGNVLLTTGAVTGKSSSRTPLANGWVEEVMAGPSAAYGPRLISLGIFSDQLNSFGGSIPKIALHGTNNPGLIGQYASNGCIRVQNDIINQIVGLMPIGSKVQIVT